MIYARAMVVMVFELYLLSKIVAMKKKLTFVILFGMLLSCRTHPYYEENFTQNMGIDFSKGKWILGNIDIDSDFRDELTKLAFDDFAKHLNDRLINSVNDRTLLIAQVVPLNPMKGKIQDLKKGTNCDFYINIKCKNERNNGNQFDVSEKTYYKEQLTFAKVNIEIYDLNNGIIVYSQGISSAFNENASLSINPARKLIFGCYAKIIDDINKKSI